MPLVDPSMVPNPANFVCIFLRPDGREDIYRPGSFLFGSLAGIPDEVARRFNGQLPCPTLSLRGVFRTTREGKTIPRHGITILQVWIP